MNFWRIHETFCIKQGDIKSGKMKAFVTSLDVMFLYKNIYFVNLMLDYFVGILEDFLLNWNRLINNRFKQNEHVYIPNSFWLIYQIVFRPFLITILIIKIEKTIDGVLWIWTPSRRMVDADDTMELWRPPHLPNSWMG